MLIRIKKDNVIKIDFYFLQANTIRGAFSIFLHLLHLSHVHVIVAIYNFFLNLNRMPLSFLFITSSLLLDHNLFGISRSYEENNNKKNEKNTGCRESIFLSVLFSPKIKKKFDLISNVKCKKTYIWRKKRKRERKRARAILSLSLNSSV